MEYEAHAKINLLLNVLGRRPDGYHELCTIMHAIDLCDTVSLEPAKKISVEADVPLPERSAARRAAEAYRDAAGTGGARISIRCRIPAEAGLGSSSADAAAVLRGMQATYGALSEAELFAIAARIGADVPFCIAGGAALCEGIGERMTRLPAMPLDLLIIKSARGVGTKALFESLALPLPMGNAFAMADALRTGNTAAVPGLVFNALYAPALRFVPEIECFAERLRKEGALAACMTGSGSAVFGIFGSRADAERAKAAFPDAAFARVCRTLPFSPET